MPDILLQDMFREVKGVFLLMNKKRANRKANQKALTKRIGWILHKDRKEIDDTKNIKIDYRRRQ